MRVDETAHQHVQRRLHTTVTGARRLPHHEVAIIETAVRFLAKDAGEGSDRPNGADPEHERPFHQLGEALLDDRLESSE